MILLFLQPGGAYAASVAYAGSSETFPYPGDGSAYIDADHNYYAYPATQRDGWFNGIAAYKVPKGIAAGMYGSNRPGSSDSLMFSDENGKLYQFGKPVNYSGVFAPNSVFNGDFVSDTKGNLLDHGMHKISGSHKIDGSQSIDNVFVDSTGTTYAITESGRTATPMQEIKLSPNQYKRYLTYNRSGYIEELFYSDQNGKLHFHGLFGDKDMGIGGLAAGQLYGSIFLIVDGNHKMWECYPTIAVSSSGTDGACRTMGSTPNLSPGLWHPIPSGANLSSGNLNIIASDSKGVVYLGSGSFGQNFGWRKTSQFTTKPDEISLVADREPGSQVFYAVATDGKIWRAEGKSSDDFSPTPLQAGSSSSNNSDCVFQTPQSGDPAANVRQVLMVLMGGAAIAMGVVVLKRNGRLVRRI